MSSTELGNGYYSPFPLSAVCSDPGCSVPGCSVPGCFVLVLDFTAQKIRCHENIQKKEMLNNNKIKGLELIHPAGNSVISSQNDKFSNVCSNFSIGVYEKIYF